MPSHSAADTVDDAPADSAVSVVGTGVWLGARPDAIFAMNLLVSWGCGAKWAHVAMLQLLSRRGQAQVATGPCAGRRRYLSPIPARPCRRSRRPACAVLREHSPATCHSSHCPRAHAQSPRRSLRSLILIQQSCYPPVLPASVNSLPSPNNSHQPQLPSLLHRRFLSDRPTNLTSPPAIHLRQQHSSA
jgi:hypothetical protein